MNRIVYTQPSMIYEDKIYNGVYEYTLNHNLGPLKQLFIKAKLSTGLAANALLSKFGLKLLKLCRIHDGINTLARVTDISQIARYDLLAGESLSYKIESSITPNVNAFTNNEFVFVHIPLMFFFSDSEDSALDLLGRKQLYLEITTEDNREAMGMGIDFTSASYEMVSVHKWTTERSVPKSIKNSYSVFTEKPVFVPNGLTSIRILMTCPFPTFYVHFRLLKTTGATTGINRVKLEIPKGIIMDIDTAINYTLADKTSENIGSTLSIPLGSRTDQNSGMKFSQEISPTYFTLTFLGHNTDGFLNIVCEHFTDLSNDEENINGLMYIE